MELFEAGPETPDLDVIEARLTAATSGPWFQGRTNVAYESARDVYSKRESDEEGAHDIATYIWSDEDAALIANAPTDLAALIAYARRLEAALTRPHPVVEAAVPRGGGKPDYEIVNGTLVARGVYEPDIPDGAYCAVPYSDAVVVIDLSALPGWPGEEHDRQIAHKAWALAHECDFIRDEDCATYHPNPYSVAKDL